MVRFHQLDIPEILAICSLKCHIIVAGFWRLWTHWGSLKWRRKRPKSKKKQRQKWKMNQCQRSKRRWDTEWYRMIQKWQKPWTQLESLIVLLRDDICAVPPRESPDAFSPCSASFWCRSASQCVWVWCVAFQQEVKEEPEEPEEPCPQVELTAEDKAETLRWSEMIYPWL